MNYQNTNYCLFFNQMMINSLCTKKIKFYMKNKKNKKKNKIVGKNNSEKLGIKIIK